MLLVFPQNFNLPEVGDAYINTNACLKSHSLKGWSKCVNNGRPFSTNLCAVSLAFGKRTVSKGDSTSKGILPFL